MNNIEQITNFCNSTEQNQIIETFKNFIAANALHWVNNSYSIDFINDDFFELPVHLGFFEWSEIDKLGVFAIKLADDKELSQRSSKLRQFEFAKKIIKQFDQYKFNGGLFLFYDIQGNKRLSFVDVQISAEKKVEYNTYRRFTYFISPSNSNKTFIQQIATLDWSSKDAIRNAFSVEPLTKSFYEEISTWFYANLKNVYFPNNENEKNLIRLITRIIFVWFLKQKNLIPNKLFDEDQLRYIVKDFGKSNNYYNAILQNLFFATLNQPIEKRKFVDGDEKSFEDNRKTYGVKNLYRYKDMFLISEKDVLKLFEPIPFLNGGLFDCLDKEDENNKVVYVDGFSRNPKHRAKIPDKCFFHEQELTVDLSEFGLGKNKKTRGLIDILKSYNFTTDENTPIDQEIALDPEMLGKIFENLLAAYVPETSINARKATGSYYTPREIVDFMVDTSLTEYFNFKLKSIDKQKIEQLLSYSEQVPDFDDEQRKIIVEAIDQIKILDPACGSGAFLMGILHKLVHILQRIDSNNKYWKETQRQKAIKLSSEAYEQENKDIRQQMLNEINEIFTQSTEDYGRKLYLIENCIYGVDIQDIAVQIAKLRFFISLVIEQNVEPSQQNYGIRSLPNLETKIVAANTLIDIETPKQDLFYTDEIQKLEQKIKQLRHHYFTASTRTEKIRLQQQDKQIRQQLCDFLLNHNFKNNTTQKIVELDLYDQTKSYDWFNPTWFFGLKEGFDIVIGNPPYIQLQKNGGELAKLYQNQNYFTFNRMGDIYTLFYERGINLLKNNGILAYITSNKWMRAGYGEKLRQFFTQYNPILLIDLGPGVFENATVDTNILLIQKQKTTNYSLAAITLQKTDKLSIAEQVKQKSIVLSKLTKDAWFIGSNAEQQLKEKIERIGKPLKEWDVKIYRGVLTGLNEAFIISTQKRNEILANCRDEQERKRTEAILKPILRGKDIKRYYYQWAGLWVIAIPAGWTDKNRKAQNPDKFIFEVFPALMNYLIDYEEKAKKRDDQGDYWWELRHCSYYPEFEKEKVVFSEIVRNPQFYFDTEKFYIEATSFLMTGKNVKYLCGLLNSKPVTYFFKEWFAGGGLGEEGYRYKKAFVEKIPLPPITPANESKVKQIEELVDKILEEKKKSAQADTTALEREIDRLVYQLYELTEEEIRLVENQTFCNTN